MYKDYKKIFEGWSYGKIIDFLIIGTEDSVHTNKDVDELWKIVCFAIALAIIYFLLYFAGIIPNLHDKYISIHHQEPCTMYNQCHTYI